MRVLIPAAVALLLGAIVTELSFRLFPDDYFLLLIAIVTAILAGSLISVRAISSARRRAGEPQARADQAPRADVPRARSSAPVRKAPGATRETGQVKWFNRTKGFGFIVRDSGGEVFVHHRNISGPGRQSLRDGQRVTFVVAEGEKGLQAEEVETADG